MVSHRDQIAGMVYMVRPIRFTANQTTKEDNIFQTVQSIPSNAQELALMEFDTFVSLLRENGIPVIVAQDTLDPHTPDSIYPNNWFVTNSDGTLSIFPMKAPNRNQESHKPALYDKLIKVYKPSHILDLRPLSREKGGFLEGTGSMVLDRYNDVAYACRSQRTDESLFYQFCDLRGYEPILFEALDKSSTPIYHTNIMMAITEDLAVICAESIANPKEREIVIQKLQDTGHECVLISMSQMHQYAGNMLGVKNLLGQRFMIMSRTAYKSLNPNQIEQITHKMGIITPDITTIETLGGGSARCMMAEIFAHKGITKELLEGDALLSNITKDNE